MLAGLQTVGIVSDTRVVSLTLLHSAECCIPQRQLTRKAVVHSVTGWLKMGRKPLLSLSTHLMSSIRGNMKAKNERLFPAIVQNRPCAFSNACVERGPPPPSVAPWFIMGRAHLKTKFHAISLISSHLYMPSAHPIILFLAWNHGLFKTCWSWKGPGR